MAFCYLCDQVSVVYHIIKLSIHQQMICSLFDREQQGNHMNVKLGGAYADIYHVN